MVADLERAARALSGAKLPASTRALLAAGPGAFRTARRTVAGVVSLVRKINAGKERRPAWLNPEEALRLGPPVPDPSKIVCLGLNYHDHCREQEGKFGRSVEPPKTPVLFAKFPSALAGPNDPIRLPPARVAKWVDFEVELAVVMGRKTRGVTRKEALGRVAGYMAINDVSARDCQFADKQWVRGKSFDTFAPCGPWIATADEVGDPHRLRLWTILNGTTMQSGTTRELIHKLPAVIAFISQAITLEAGDIIATGTPAGVGIFREPKVLLKPGDSVECGIERIGTICNPVVRG
jgi:acylpyruvate hydrolase